MEQLRLVADTDDSGGMPTFSTEEVARLAGLSYRQADHWVHAGAVVLSHNVRGTGHPRRWTMGEALVLTAIGRVAGDLKRVGTPMSTALVARLWSSFLANQPLTVGHVTFRPDGP